MSETKKFNYVFISQCVHRLEKAFYFLGCRLEIQIDFRHEKKEKGVYTEGECPQHTNKGKRSLT